MPAKDRLVDDRTLEASAVVANCDMNRLRGLDGYRRELGLDVVATLVEAVRRHGTAHWLDLCCGSGNALTEARRALTRYGLADRVTLTGVDLVDHFDPAARAAADLHTASVTTWPTPPGARYDLITCVHGLHYVGDKLLAVTRAVATLAPDGRFVAHLAATALRSATGGPLTRRFHRALRDHDVQYHPRARRLSCTGPRDIDWRLTYLGADADAGPNHTGQPAVDSYYRPAGD
ncbi:methyltransferase family protein [Stackebrandtia albiflava]|uniref:Methyltransferase family protein n=1 Tax=Stackebrandtia albiflava TaxID=406432 RepID=A0A562VCK8_9ACTN|nr:methyltransferase domain-containing protein [Stackebrandtia albiflava]TWJ15595.1 methyltransferase family protein [Stackebrandtia albiflava]